MPRILALDIGDKRIGAAITDELGVSARPLATIVRKPGHKADVRAIAEIVTELCVSTVVVGIPVNSDGSEGPQAAKAREFAAKLRDGLNARVETCDEFLTTAEAQEMLIRAGKSRSDRRKLIDQAAAVLILEAYLKENREPEAEAY